MGGSLTRQYPWTCGPVHCAPLMFPLLIHPKRGGDTNLLTAELDKKDDNKEKVLLSLDELLALWS